MVISNSFDKLFDLSLDTKLFKLPNYTPCSLKVEFESHKGSGTVFNGKEPALPFATTDIFHAPILDWRRLSAESEDCKPVYEVSFDVTESNFAFKPGDTIGVIPRNNASEVDFIITHLDLKAQADQRCIITANQTAKTVKIPHLPEKSTLRHILTHVVDIRGVIKKLFLLALSKHTKDESERTILEYLCSKENTAAYTEHILNKNTCLIDVFKIFKSCKPPIEIVLANLPRLLPRPYSIVSSRLSDPNIIKICFSVIDLGNNRKGLTTSWIEDIILNQSLKYENELQCIEDRLRDMDIRKNNEKIPIYLRSNMSKFSMPENMEAPLILIGPGTGVAPYIGFLEERKILKNKNPGLNLGEVWLYYGCRNPDLDFLYRQELNDFISDGVLNKLRTAFSRVQSGKKYIQDLLLEDGEEIVKFIDNGAFIYICGDLNSMTSQIKNVFVKCLVEYSNRSEQEAMAYISDLQKGNRYLVDMWT